MLKYSFHIFFQENKLWHFIEIRQRLFSWKTKNTHQVVICWICLQWYLDSFQVQCEMRPGLGITRIYPVKTSWVFLGISRPEITYIYEHSVDHIKSVIETSNYCSQKMTFVVLFITVLRIWCFTTLLTLFKSSGRWERVNEMLCAINRCTGMNLISPRKGFEVGRTNHSATQTLMLHFIVLYINLLNLSWKKCLFWGIWSL